ncbi:MAG TPA: SRPBCC family protein [Methylococcus sp.]|nr:SRPBCC family protein [Methylococcus sp.]
MKSISLLAVILFAPLVLAHGPTPQKVVEAVEIAAPVERVWNAVKDFAAIARWHPGLAASEGNDGNAPGARRTLRLRNGEEVVEELDAYDEANREYAYRLRRENVKAIPASSYSAVFKVTAAGDGARVEWKSRLYRGDTGNMPPEELNDEAAVRAMQSFFRSGLDHLKTMLESSG